MTRFRCPYCKTTFEHPRANCPSCGKTMVIPTHLTGLSAHQRKRARDRIQRQADHQLRQIHGREAPVGRKPLYIMLILVFMTILGTLLMGRLKIAEMTRADSRPPPEETAEYELNILRAAVELFQRDCRRYPREEEGFWALLVNPGNTSWDGPYVNVVKRDPWRNPYRYIVTSNAVTVASNGPDGEPDTADDLSPTDWPVLMPPPESSASLPGP